MILFQCENCGAKLQAEDRKAGSIVKCPACKQAAGVPELLNIPASLGHATPPPLPTQKSRLAARSWWSKIGPLEICLGLILLSPYLALPFFPDLIQFWPLVHLTAALIGLAVFLALVAWVLATVTMSGFGTFLIVCGCIGCFVHLIGGGIVVIAGLLFFGFGSMLPSGACPACNGDLHGQPRVCQHCRSTVHWLKNKPVTAEAFERSQLAELERRTRQRAAGARFAAIFRR